MATFTLIGTPEPFLHASLARGESLYCESNAMVMMEDTLELKGRLQGGVVQSFLRRFANDESLFQQEITAARGAGDCLLSAALDGDMQIMEVGARQYTLSDGAFVAASSGVEVKAKMQNIAGAVFGQTGGFFVMHTSGQGQLVVSGAGTLFELEVTPDKDVIIDNGHVVCWDSGLQYSISASTTGGGLVGNLVNSLTSGEGIVLRFSGSGKVVISSRNHDSFLAWVRAKLGLGKN